jgi:hypothetical protein
LVSGYRVLRATTMAVEFEAEPPGWEMPPLEEGGRSKREARYFVVRFSMRVRTGETWYTWAWVWVSVGMRWGWIGAKYVCVEGCEEEFARESDLSFNKLLNQSNA